MITLDEARTIAYAWHGGGGSPLYSFASTSNDGTPRNITPDTVREVDQTSQRIQEPDAGEYYQQDVDELQTLRAYLVANMPEQPEEEEDDEPEYSGSQCPHGARSGEHCSACGEIPFDQ